jgi:hypothetical protein
MCYTDVQRILERLLEGKGVLQRIVDRAVQVRV